MKTCRICVKRKKKFEILSNLINNVLYVVFLDNMNLDLTKNVIICTDCMEYLIGSFNFKTECLYSEDALCPYFKENEKININLVPLPQFQTEILDEKYAICRFCCKIATENYTKLMEICEDDATGVAIRRFLPEINVFSVESPIICQHCQVSLHLINEFLESCQKNELQIKLVYEKFGKPFDLDDVEVNKLEDKKSNESLDSDFEDINEIKIEEHPLLDTKLESESHDKESSSKQSGQTPIRQCQYCGCTVKYDHLKHLDSSNKQIYSCFKCDRKRVHKCDICGKSYKYRFDLYLHNKFKHTDVPKFKCNICNAKFKEKLTLRRHLACHSPQRRYKCDMCPYAFKRSVTLKHHRQIHFDSRDNLKFKYNICNAKFKDKSNLKRNLTGRSVQRRYKCEMSQSAFKRSATLKNHRQTHFDDRENRKFKCLLCPYIAKRKDTLKTHMVVHNNNRTMKCSKCTYLAKSRTRLKQHMEIHYSVKNYACEKCAFKTASRRSLKKHKDVHLGVKKFRCDLCVYKCSRKDGLKRHKILVHSPKSVILTCSYCIFKCKYKNSLEKHSITHLTPQCTYTCFKCSYRTSIAKHYQKHMILHDTCSSWNKCDKCSFESSNKHQLERHLLVHTEERRIKCNFCDFLGKRKDIIMRHQIVRHENNVKESFECFLCGYISKRKDCLAGHIKTKHARTDQRNQ